MKTLCDWSKKALENKQDKLWKIVRDPTFYCRKCGRVANQKKALCKATRFEIKENTDEEARAL